MKERRVGSLQPCPKPPWGTLNALDVATGEYPGRVPLEQVDELEKKDLPGTGRQNLPANAQVTPMTFAGRGGCQCVVIAAGGGGVWRKLSSPLSDELIAFALPL